MPSKPDRNTFVVICLLVITALLVGCSQQKDLDSGKTRTEAEEAKIELAKTKADLAKANAQINASKVTLAKEPVAKTVSAETRSNIVTLFEKTAKLRASTEQGTNFIQLKNLIVEVKSSQDTVKLLGWPAGWEIEQSTFEASVEAWSLGKEIWETKLEFVIPIDKYNFSMNAYELYGDKLNKLSDLVTSRTGDTIASARLKSILMQEGGKPIIMADTAIQWCFFSASQAFDKSHEGLRLKLRQ